MKILQINSTANRGSTGRIAEQIGLLIQNEGWASIIAFGRDANPSSSRLYRIGNGIDIKLHGLKSLVLGKHGLGSAKPTYGLLDFIKEENIDIVHLHNIHGYYLNLEILFEELSKLNVQVVWTLHDCWAFTGHCTHFSDINCNRWKIKCYSCPKIGNYPKSLFFDNSEFFFEKKQFLFNLKSLNIVTVSKWLKGLVNESFLNKHNTISISNGVDENTFILQEKNSKLLKSYGLEKKTILLAASTSWAKQKGFDDYIKLAALLSPNNVIVLLGLPDRLKKSLPSNIVGVSRTENMHQLASWYSTADIVLNLSYQESFGLTSVEGFMCGKPTIVYNATASPELIVDPELGVIVTPGDVYAVKQSVESLINSEINHSRIREIAIKNYGANSQYSKYISLYKSILGLK